ncbi:LrgB family protein [Ammoniphilus sp. 3BR4]|uniref:LrgB family protein n=1 Tax=Ammoniphilus sp. 3BR4 TaxID=3158265 RepID=UPI0034659B1C
MTVFYPAIWFVLTIVLYVLVARLYKKYPFIWLNPLYICPLLLIFILGITHTNYVDYRSGTEAISFFLGPVELVMMISLYRNFAVLKRHFTMIITGVLFGTSAGVFFVTWIADTLDLGQLTILSLAPKSTTAPMAVSVSSSLGGLPELTAIFAMITALTGLLIGPALIRWLGISNKIVKGLVMGTAASMVGAAKAAQWGELEGAMGVLGMALSALFMPLLAGCLLLFY